MTHPFKAILLASASLGLVACGAVELPGDGSPAPKAEEVPAEASAPPPASEPMSDEERRARREAELRRQQESMRQDIPMQEAEQEPVATPAPAEPPRARAPGREPANTPSRTVEPLQPEPVFEEPAVIGCPMLDAGLPDFPWQPPEPSAKVTIPRAILLGGVEADDQTLSRVADRIERALGEAGYREYSYHAIGCDGFALITRLERIAEDGEPVEGADRFAPPEQDASWSLSGYISRLFYAPPGYYRQIIFAATDEPYDRQNLAEAPTREELEEVLADGEDFLPEESDDVPFTRRHALHALIYEFEKGAEPEQVAQLNPSRLGGSVHLNRAGIYDSLDEN